MRLARGMAFWHVLGNNRFVFGSHMVRRLGLTWKNVYTLQIQIHGKPTICFKHTNLRNKNPIFEHIIVIRSLFFLLSYSTFIFEMQSIFWRCFTVKRVLHFWIYLDWRNAHMHLYGVRTFSFSKIQECIVIPFGMHALS